MLVAAACAVLVVVGLQAFRDNPKDALPDIAENQVNILTEWPGRSPRDVDEQITYLDQATSRADGDNLPNENYAREIMEFRRLVTEQDSAFLDDEKAEDEAATEAALAGAQDAPTRAQLSPRSVEQ